MMQRQTVNMHRNNIFIPITQWLLLHPGTSGLEKFHEIEDLRVSLGSDSGGWPTRPRPNWLHHANVVNGISDGRAR